MRIIAALAAGLTAAALAPAAPPSLYPARDLDTPLGRVADIAFSSDGRRLAAGGRGYGIWDAQTGNPIRSDASVGALRRVAFGAQGTLLALGGEDGRIRVVDLRAGTIRDLAKHN